ncbi:unnamed protein product [Closterium sp. NIES-65]|nr:unnamed protein product [Closterium sp. NIES-65]
MSLGSGSPLAPSVSPPARWGGGQQCVLHEVTRFDTLAGIAIRYGAQGQAVIPSPPPPLLPSPPLLLMTLPPLSHLLPPLPSPLHAGGTIVHLNWMDPPSPPLPSPPLPSPPLHPPSLSTLPLSLSRAVPLVMAPPSLRPHLATLVNPPSRSSSHAGSSQQRTEQHGTGSSSPAATTSAAMASGSGSGGGAGSLSEAILQLVSAQAAAEHAEAHSRNLAAAEAAGRARASTFFFVQMREAEQYVSSEGEEPSPPCQRGTSLSEGEGDEGGRRLSWLGGGVGGFYSGAQGRGAGRSTWTGEARQTSAQEFGWGLGVQEGGGGTSTWRGGYGSEGEGGWASGEEEVGGRGVGASRRRRTEQSASGSRAGGDGGLGVWGLMSSSGPRLFVRGGHEGAGSRTAAANLGAAARWGGRVVEDLLWRFHKSTSFSTFENAGLLNASAVAGGLTRSPLRRDPSGSLSAGIDLPSTRSWSRPSSVAAAVEVGGSGDGSVLLGCSTPIKGGEGGVCDDGSSTAVGGSAVYGSVTRRGVSSRRGKGVPADITG